MHPIPTLIITGLSGSGKSTVMRALEDAGFHCIDNLPPVLMPRLLELCTASSAEITKIAMVMDVRERSFLKEYPAIFRALKEQGQELTILFLESTDEVLVRRYNETRRQHPLAEQGTVLEGIHKEREMLSGLRMLADEIIDTSNLSIDQLRNMISDLFRTAGQRKMHHPHLIRLQIRRPRGRRSGDRREVFAKPLFHKRAPRSLGKRQRYL